MRDAGEIETLARGVYRLGGLAPMSNPDLATVGMRVPNGVICLIFALAFHKLITQVPHEIHVAISRTARPLRLDFPPLRIYRFSTAAFKAGLDTHSIDRISVRIYSAEKTLADCFKYRSKIGVDVVLEAVRNYRQRGRPQFKKRTGLRQTVQGGTADLPLPAGVGVNRRCSRTAAILRDRVSSSVSPKRHVIIALCAIYSCPLNFKSPHKWIATSSTSAQ